MGGEVHAIVVQEDGKIILGGDFSSVNGVTRWNVARLNIGGTLDLTWNPGCNGVVSNLVLSGSELFVSGAFTIAGGLPRTHLAKISTLDAGLTDPGWAPQPDGEVRCLALSGANLFVAGGFTWIGGQSAAGVAKLSTQGTGAAMAWSAPPSGGPIHAMLATPDHVFLAGSFSAVNSAPRHFLAKVDNATGALDLNWQPNPDRAVHALAASGSELLVAGAFTTLGGVTGGAPVVFQPYLAKISMSGAGAADAAWNPALTALCEEMIMYSVATDATHVYVTGQFDHAGGLDRTGVARLRLSDGQPDAQWFPQVRTFNRLCNFDDCGYPECTIVSEDFVRVRTVVPSLSRIYAGGRFSLVGNQTALGLVKLDSVAGTADPTFPVQTGRQILDPTHIEGKIFATALEDDGKLLIGGRFELINGEPRLNLARLNTDGSLDPFWQPNPNDRVLAIATRGNDIFVGGDFTWIGGVNRSNLAKLSASGSDAADPDWSPTPNSRVSSIAVRGTNLCVVGDFTEIGEPPWGSGGAALVSTEGRGEILSIPDVSIGYPFGYSLYGWFANVVMDDTYAYIHGVLLRVGPRSNIGRVRLDTGEVDLNWGPVFAGDPFDNPNAVEALVVSETNIYIGGYFGLASGHTNLARLDYTTGAAFADWRPQPLGLGNHTQLPPRLLLPCSALLLSGSNLYVGGTFTNLGVFGLSRLARLDAFGTGAVDPYWLPQLDDAVYRLVARNNDLYAVGLFSNAGYTLRSKLALFAFPDPPSLVPRSATEFVVLRNPSDGEEVTHFAITSVTGGQVYHKDTLAYVPPGTFITIEQGEAGLIYDGPGVGTVTVYSSLNDSPLGLGSPPATLTLGTAAVPAFSFSSARYSTGEQSNVVRITVRKWGSGAATVQYATADGTALAYDSNTDTGDYVEAMGTLSFSAETTSKSFTVFVYDDDVFNGDRSFWIMLGNPSGNGQLAYPTMATVTIVDDDAVGSTASLTINRMPEPAAPPPSAGILRVFLEPAGALGQWRLPADLDWRNAATTAGGLVTGNYPIEFKPVYGYLEPATETFPITSGATESITRYYTPLAPNTGSGQLVVMIKPGHVATNADTNLRGQWRKQGEANWRNSGEEISGLNAGLHVIEFKSLLQYAAPEDQIAVVGANQRNVKVGTYLYAGSIGEAVPVLLSFGEATTAEPYLYNGQIKTDLGFGSGVVVKERVVLTAAHVLFDDQSLSYARAARWFLQRYAGLYEPVPQTPRGWYIFEGYAAARMNDIATGTSPGVATPDSQMWDAAALYFVESPIDANRPGRGGYAGYLVSDGVMDEWLIGNGLKMLVGYPVAGVAEEDRGKMHATVPVPVHFSNSYGHVFATSDIRGFPGNSGGALWVRHENGTYYPAAIYLGGVAQSLVRAIDSQVIDLINRAEISGQRFVLFTGGGVARWSPSSPSTAFAPGLFRVTFAPPDALALGGGWRVTGTDDPTWITSTNLYFPLNPGSFDIQFKPLSGYITPSTRRVEVYVEQATVVEAVYQPVHLSSPRRLPDQSFQMTLHGETGRSYTLQWSQALSNWAELRNVNNLTGATHLIDLQATNHTPRFYRALER